MLVFINRHRFTRFIKISNNRIFLYILFIINELTLFISKIKIIKYYFIHNYLLKHKFKNHFNQIRLFQKNDLSTLKQSFIITIKNA